jgi:hypothetical protein
MILRILVASEEAKRQKANFPTPDLINLMDILRARLELLEKHCKEVNLSPTIIETLHFLTQSSTKIHSFNRPEISSI